MNWIFSVVYHPVRIKMGISVNEYVVLDLVYKTQTHPEYTRNGWCETSYKKLSEHTGLSKGSLHGIFDRMVKKDLLEINEINTKQKKVTKNFYKYAYESQLSDELIAEIERTTVRFPNVQKSNVQIPNEVVQKSNGKRSDSERKRSDSEHIKVNKVNTKETLKENIEIEISKSSKKVAKVNFMTEMAVKFDEHYQRIFGEKMEHWATKEFKGLKLTEKAIKRILSKRFKTAQKNLSNEQVLEAYGKFLFTAENVSNGFYKNHFTPMGLYSQFQNIMNAYKNDKNKAKQPSKKGHSISLSAAALDRQLIDGEISQEDYDRLKARKTA